MAVELPGGGEALHENADPVGGVGHGGRQAQEDKKGNGEKGAAAGQGIDKPGYPPAEDQQKNIEHGKTLHPTSRSH